MSKKTKSNTAAKAEKIVKPTKTKQVVKPEVKAEGPKVRKVRNTMSAAARAKIAEGCTFEQLDTFLKKEWKLPESKSWYVNWYFSEAVNKGRITEKQRQIAKGKIEA